MSASSHVPSGCRVNGATEDRRFLTRRVQGTDTVSRPNGGWNRAFQLRMPPPKRGYYAVSYKDNLRLWYEVAPPFGEWL
jgi:hypothetical protein